MEFSGLNVDLDSDGIIYFEEIFSYLLARHRGCCLFLNFFFVFWFLLLVFIPEIIARLIRFFHLHL